MTGAIASATLEDAEGRWIDDADVWADSTTRAGFIPLEYLGDGMGYVGGACDLPADGTEAWVPVPGRGWRLGLRNED